MANKPASRNWNDIQIVIATGSMALTLVFWNLFAGPDRETAIKRAQEQAALPPPQPIQTAAPVVEVQPTLQKRHLARQWSHSAGRKRPTDSDHCPEVVAVEAEAAVEAAVVERPPLVHRNVASFVIPRHGRRNACHFGSRNGFSSFHFG